VLSHGYDAAHPQPGGKWLGKPLEAKGIPLKTGREIIRIIVDEFNIALAGFSREFPDYHDVDLRGWRRRDLVR
jgi:hypothetical protein